MNGGSTQKLKHCEEMNPFFYLDNNKWENKFQVLLISVFARLWGVKSKLLRPSQFKICLTAESQVKVCKLCIGEENNVFYIGC